MKHLKYVENYPGSLYNLAREIVDMRYDSIAELFGHLAEKLLEDAENDRKRGRLQLSSKLESVARDSLEIQKKMLSIWELCKKYIK